MTSTLTPRWTSPTGIEYLFEHEFRDRHSPGIYYALILERSYRSQDRGLPSYNRRLAKWDNGKLTVVENMGLGGLKGNPAFAIRQYHRMRTKLARRYVPLFR